MFGGSQVFVTHSYNKNILYISILGLEGLVGSKSFEGFESLNGLENLKS